MSKGDSHSLSSVLQSSFFVRWPVSKTRRDWRTQIFLIRCFPACAIRRLPACTRISIEIHVTLWVLWRQSSCPYWESNWVTLVGGPVRYPLRYLFTPTLTIRESIEPIDDRVSLQITCCWCYLIFSVERSNSVISLSTRYSVRWKSVIDCQSSLDFRKKIP